MLNGRSRKLRWQAPSLLALLLSACLPKLSNSDTVSPPLDDGSDAGTSGSSSGAAEPSAGQGSGSDAGVMPPAPSSVITFDSLETPTTLGYMLQGEAFGDNLAASLAAAGDVNGDGLADFIIGAPGPASITSPEPSEGGAGGAFVVFGSLDRSRPTLTALGERGFVINGAAAGANAGRLVSGAGDLNGDGLDDLLISAFGPDRVPEVYVVFGKAGNVAPVSLAALGTGGFLITGFTVEGGIPLDPNGIIAAAAGDVNGDGLGDVILGALTNNNSELGFGGYAFVVFGKRTGVAPVSVDALGAGGFRIEDIVREYRRPLQVAGAGDFNGDGLDDAIVGGAADGMRVVYGKRDVQNVYLASSGFDSFAIQSNGEEVSVSAAGDVNGDGFDDVLVGDPLAKHPVSDPGTGEVRFIGGGNAYVVFGRPLPGQARLPDIETDGQDGFVIYGVDEGDGVGIAIASAGDVNGDGYADLLLGAEGAWIGPQSEKPPTDDYLSFARNFGGAYVVFGVGANAERVSLAAIEAGTSAGIALGDRKLGEVGGASVAGAGDIDGDGFDDVLIGTAEYEPFYGDPVSIDSRGKVYVLFGSEKPELTAALGVRSTLRRGPANDALVMTADFNRGGISGGYGTDTLSLAAPLLELRLEQGILPNAAPAVHTSVKSVEVIDLTTTPGATLLLDEAAIRRLPQSQAALPFGLAKRLVVLGSASNTLRTTFDLGQWDRLGTDQGLDVYRPVGAFFGAFYGLAISPALTVETASPPP